MNKSIVCGKCKFSTIQEINETQSVMFCEHHQFPTHKGFTCGAYEPQPDVPNKHYELIQLHTPFVSPTDAMKYFTTLACKFFDEGEYNKLMIIDKDNVYLLPKPKNMIGLLYLLDICDIKYSLDKDVLVGKENNTGGLNDE